MFDWLKKKPALLKPEGPARNVFINPIQWHDCVRLKLQAIANDQEITLDELTARIAYRAVGYEYEKPD